MAMPEPGNCFMTSELRFVATESRGEVSALLLRPRGARALLVMGHGAGAGMRHPFLEAVCDRLAEMERIKPVCQRLDATLHIVEGGDHFFHVPKRSGRTDAEALDEIAAAIDRWLRGLAR